jgi:hypothetical protein
MKKIFALATALSLVCSTAYAGPPPVNDRCANTNALTTVILKMNGILRPRNALHPAFSIDPNSMITVSYDKNLEKVICRVDMTVYVTLLDTRYRYLGELVLAAHGEKKHPTELFYSVQLISGDSTRFEVTILNGQKGYR